MAVHTFLILEHGSLFQASLIYTELHCEFEASLVYTESSPCEFEASLVYTKYLGY